MQECLRRALGACAVVCRRRRATFFSSQVRESLGDLASASIIHGPEARAAALGANALLAICGQARSLGEPVHHCWKRTGQRVVLCIDHLGIACIVVEADGIKPNRENKFVPEGSEPWPTIQLHRTAQGAASWMLWKVGMAAPTELCDAAAVQAELQRRVMPTESGRRLVVAAIENYYQQHVLEPSVAGFLSILEKQFARSDLYLFELLQNAVDEGAMSVRVDLNSSPPGLRFAHDGKGFSPLDVNGLASVGMSTKATKRAVG